MNTAGKNSTATLIAVLLGLAAVLIFGLGKDLGLGRFVLAGVLFLAAALTPFSLLMITGLASVAAGARPAPAHG